LPQMKTDGRQIRAKSYLYFICLSSVATLLSSSL
jgi:hypothetical protein